MGLLERLNSLLAPRKLDVKTRFELLREGVAGTMSKFYRARDRKTGEVVGLKILDRKKTEAFEARFKGLKKPCEGKIATSLNHPNIVRTLEYGWTTDRSPYLVMEYLEGAGLNFLLMAQSAQLENHRLQFIRQVAEALQAVHEAGYIHRDVCPRNLMLTGYSESVKLIDFGLGRRATWRPNSCAVSPRISDSTYLRSGLPPLKSARTSFPGRAARRDSRRWLMKTPRPTFLNCDLKSIRSSRGLSTPAWSRT